MVRSGSMLRPLSPDDHLILDGDFAEGEEVYTD
jgi:hypothetical protein